MQDVSEKIDKLMPVTFNYKGDDKKNYGLIAEDVHKIFPEIITKDSNDKINGLRYMQLITILLKEIQSMRKRIKNLEN